MEFKRHPDFSKYKIYKNGDVYREWKSKDRLLKHILGNRGYYVVGLRNGCKEKKFQLHRLLAILFIPNPDSKKEVDHINRVKTDNRLENLRWANSSEQNLNQELKDTNTGFPFISKYKNKCGFCFSCVIQRNRKFVLNTGRSKLEDAIEIVRQTLLENDWVFVGYDGDKINKIKEMFNMS